jgi:hypothetical protein
MSEQQVAGDNVAVLESGGAESALSQWRHVWLPLAWAAGGALIWRAAATGTSDPAGKAYGVNWPMDAPETLGRLTVEVALLYVVLRPWSYRASWGRAAGALVVAVPYALLAFAASTHAGPIVGAHLLWLALVVVGLVVTTVVSARAARRARADGRAGIETAAPEGEPRG